MLEHSIDQSIDRIKRRFSIDIKEKFGESIDSIDSELIMKEIPKLKKKLVYSNNSFSCVYQLRWSNENIFIHYDKLFSLIYYIAKSFCLNSGEMFQEYYLYQKKFANYQMYKVILKRLGERNISIFELRDIENDISIGKKDYKVEKIFLNYKVLNLSHNSENISLLFNNYDQIVNTNYRSLSMSEFRERDGYNSRELIRIFLKRGDRCGICGDRILSEYDANIDHVIPKYCGGGNELSNLQVAHIICNQYKGPLHPEEFEKIKKPQ